MEAVVSTPVALESSVLRYYTSQLMLRVLPSDDYDPDGASFAAFGSTDASPFISIYDAPPNPSSVLSLQRTPSVAVLPPTLKSNAAKEDPRIARGVFTVLPAEGFAKEPGQPVYYNDPIELMDQHGRLLGIVGRSPHAGHLAADGHSGALVFVFERHTSRVQNIGKRFFRQEMRSISNVSHTSSESDTGSTHSSSAPSSNQATEESIRQSWGLTRKQSMVAVCGGERLRIPGLRRVAKRPFPGESIVQHQSGSDTSSDRKSLAARDDEPSYLTCEIVLTSQPAPAPASEGKAPSSQKKTASQVADRTATGEFVGVLHSGILHRRSDHMKIWKKRFFVLTQVALHRFDAHETLDSIKTQKTRGAIFLKDCRGIRYERFARPHELEILLNNGKVFSLHAVDALTCAQWASVLSQAIENPQWVHAERGYLTVWRSDAQFESPQCPKITKVALMRGVSKLQTCTSCDLGSSKKGISMVSEQPTWSEKLSLGSISASGFVMVQLADGSIFRITLEDLTKSIVRPHWIAVATSLEVAKIQSLGEDGDDMPGSLSDELPLRRSELVVDDKSRFLVRLKFQADLQLDQRLTQRRSIVRESRLLAGAVAVLLVLPAVFYGGRQRAMDPTARSFCLVGTVLAGLIVVLLGPVAWQMYLWLRFNKSMEGELHWFISLLALEVRPHGDEISDRSSTSSGEDSRSRSRVESFIDDDEMSEHAALVMPTRPSFLGDELSSLSLSSPSASAQAIRTFRLENALDSILGRPQLSFFAIKKYFPTRFLPRDESGRRVLLVELNKVSRKGLKSHNVSGFNVVRYFLYLWEFIWSYQDLHENATDSKLVLIVDCSGWKYFRWFGIECQILMNMLEITHNYYPGRLAKVIFVRDYATYGLYGRLVAKCMDPTLRALFDLKGEMPAYLKDTIESVKPSRDETLLTDFVTNVLATAANVLIPNFTRRELEQAARFAKTGSLDEGESDGSTTTDTIGTRAVLLPDGWQALEWQQIQHEDDFTMWRLQDPKAKESVKGTSFQSDAQVSQWRGRLKMKSTNADVVAQYLNDPKLAESWMRVDDHITVLDKLSRQEDISFWSRRVPFMSFSLSGHRGRDGQRQPELETNAFFECVMRRIYEAKKGKRPQDRVCTTMWKTTSAQPMVVNRPPLTAEQQTKHGAVHWRKLEDPFVSLCFVVEEIAKSMGKKELTLSFWFQSFAPPATASQNAQIAKLIMKKMRALDECVAKLPFKD